MTRKSKLETLRMVRKCCSKIRNNINANKVSKATGLKWSTVQGNLELLEECGVIMKQDSSYMYYGVIQDIWDNYFAVVEEYTALKESIQKIKELT